MTALQFLLLEANRPDAEVIQATLTASKIDCKVVQVSHSDAFITALETQTFDLILADYNVPALCNGLALELARNVCPETPLIFVSTSIDATEAIAALEAGAASFVLKSQLERLVPAVQRALQAATERCRCQQIEAIWGEQNRLLDFVASGHSLEACFAAIGRSLARLNPQVRACFWVSETERQTFPHSITSGLPTSFIKGLWRIPPSSSCVGICGETVYRGRPIIEPDLPHANAQLEAIHAPWAKDWRDLCLNHQIFACYAQPIMTAEGRPIASLLLCFNEARLPTPWEYQLVDFATQIARLAYRRDRAGSANLDAKYRALFESIDAGFCICEMLFDEQGNPHDYRFLEVNSVFGDLTGLQHATGKTARELVPNLESFWIETYGRVVQTGETVRFEQQSLAMNRWFDVNAFCLDSHDHQFGILFTNISDRKQAELEREGFLAAGSDLQVITGNQGYFRWVSPSFEHILGWTPEEMIARPWTDFVHPDDIHASLAETDNLFAGSQKLRFENRYRHKNGSYRWLLWNSHVASEQQVIYATAMDITERRYIEAALRESEELKQRILESSNDCIKVLNLAGEILYINAGGLTLLEIDDLRYVLNTSWLDWWQGDNYASAKAAIATAKAGTMSQMRGNCLTYKGTPKWWDSVVTPLRDASGQVVQLVVIARDITQQKHAEDVLRDSEERFRTMTNYAPFMVWVTDASGSCTYLSQSWYNFTGQTPESGLGLGRFDPVHPADREKVERLFWAANERREAFRQEYRLQRKDGEFIWAIDAASPWFGVDGQFKGLIGSIIDISDRKRIEVDLMESEEKYRTLFESIDEGFCIVELIFDEVGQPIDYRFLIVNPAFERQTGHRNVVGKRIREIIPQHEDCWFERYGQVALTGEAIRVEDRSEGFDGWYEVHAFRVGKPELRRVGILFNNITERKRAEEELRQKNAILNVINESTPTPIFVKDRQGRFIYVNPATLDVLGKSAAEVMGYRDCDVYPNPADAALVMENDQRIMESGQMEIVEETPDGVRTFLGIKVPYRNELGEIVGLIGISNDITERIQIERDREWVLQQEQAARESAEEANRLKDEFLAVLSHELRSPLNPILGWSKLLQTGKLDEARTKQALSTIERNAKLQAELIEDLLDVSRILRGKLSLNVSSVNLAIIVHAAIETVRLAADAKAIQIETMLDPKMGLIPGDSTRLQQVVWNLLSNAVKFTPVGGKVEVKLEQVEGGCDCSTGAEASRTTAQPQALAPLTMLSNPYVQITVSDTGKGISPEFLPHVFDYFRQEDGATTRKFGGLGLGLAIVRHLVELHGGTIRADSPGEGMGATFTVCLPLHHDRQVEAAERQRALQAIAANLGEGATTQPALTHLRILVVDDEEDSRDFIRFVLEQAGATVMTAASAEQALTTLMRVKLDLLLSDIGMPMMNGYMLMQQVRTLPANQGGTIPAIALTAYAGEFDQRQALSAGFQRHISKPVEPETLVKAIVTLLGQVTSPKSVEP